MRTLDVKWFIYVKSKANTSLFITTKQRKGGGDKTPGVFNLGTILRRITEKERKLGSVYQTVDVNDI